MANLCSLAAVGNFSKLDKDFSGSFSGTIVSYLEMKHGIGEPKDTSSHSSSPWGAWAVPALVPNPPEGQSSVWVDCHLTWPYFPRHVYLCIPSLCELHKQDQEMGRRQAWGSASMPVPNTYHLSSQVIVATPLSADDKTEDQSLVDFPRSFIQ